MAATEFVSLDAPPADTELFDCEATVDVDSTDSRPLNFFCDADSAASGDVILLLIGVTAAATGVDRPICDTVLHKLPSGGYLDRTLSLSICVV